METHAVPQHIQAYEFHLVGDMTLKQFSELAAGLVLALIIYSLPLFGFIKWPLVILFTLIGVALAFLPFEERPLETWIIAFLKAIYSPTQYLWRKGSHPPEILVSPLVSRPLPAAEATASPADRDKLQKYLQALPHKEPAAAPVREDQALLNQIDQLFETVSLPQTLNPSVRPGPEIVKSPSLTPHPLHPMADMSGPAEIVIPAGPPSPPLPPEKVPRHRQVSKTATFSLQIPIPVAPTIPNLVVGMVLDPENKIVENAILEIHEAATGHPVRAMKTNKIGQFNITTPLKTGTYEIVAEKEGLSFEPVRFEAKGDIILPIDIRAKSANPPLAN